MWKQLVNVLTRIGLLTLVPMLIGVGSAQAQSFEHKIQVDIPFDFIVGSKRLPAGEYSVGRAQSHSDDSVLAISSSDRSTNILSSTFAVQSPEQNSHGKLIFHRYGDQYFLFQI